MIASFFAEMGVLASGHVSLLMMLLKTTIILVAALGITLAMQRSSAGARHLVWVVTLGMLLLIPALATWAPLPLRVLPSASVPSIVTSEPLWSSVPWTAPANDLHNANGARSTPQVPLSQTSGSKLISTLREMSGVSLILTLWATVVAGILATLTWAGFTVRRIVRRARPLESQDWVTPLFEIADRLGLEQPPRLLQSNDAKMPFACGVLRPTIVLPTESENWNLDRRRAVLLHELAHVRRHDLLGHTLGRLVCAVYWFHPLVWTASKRLRSESERACDDLALACGTRATDYAEHLLDIVTSVRGDATPLVALAMARRKEFEGRMLAILDPGLRRSTPSRRQSVALIAALALVSITVGAVSPVARSADAAPVVQLRWDAEPSPVLRVKPISRAPSPSTVISRSTHVSPLTRTHSTSDAAITVITNAGVNLGLNVASSVMQSLAQGGTRDKGNKAADERPLLLAKVLRSDSSASLRRIAAWGLQEYADSPVAAEVLALALRRDADVTVREMAGWALGHGSDRTAGTTDALLSALKGDANEKVRAIAAWALGNIHDKASAEALSSALADPSPSVRTRAAWALGNAGLRQAPRMLVALLKDEDARVREIAAWALFNIEDPSAAPALEAALKVEQNKELQLDYIRALAALGDKSIDALKGLLDSPDPRIKATVVRALAGGRASGPWPWPWPDPRPFP